MNLLKHGAARYGLAAAIALVATWLRWVIEPLIGPNVAYMTVFPAIMVVAVTLGAGPGLTSAALGVTLVEWFFFRSKGEGLDYTVSGRAAFVLATSAYVGWVSSRLRSARAQANAHAEQLQHLNALMDHASEALIVRELGGTIRFWNQGAANLYGWSSAEALGKLTADLLRTEGVPLSEKDIQLTQSGQWEGVLTHTARDGRRVVVESSQTATHAADGRLLILESDRDITERRQAEQEREATVELLKLVSLSSSLREMAQAAVAFFRKYSGCEAIGLRLTEGEDYPYYESCGLPPEFVSAENRLCLRDADGKVVLDPAGRPALSCLCGRVIRGQVESGQPFFTAHGSFWTNRASAPSSGATADGAKASAASAGCCVAGFESLALLPLRAGKDCFGLLQLSDRRPDRFAPLAIAMWERLTDHLSLGLAKVLAEQSLRQSESFYRQTLESVPGMTFTTRPDGYCDYQSQQWVNFTGVPVNEHLGDGWNNLLHPDDRARAYAAWFDAVDGRAPYDLEYRVRRYDGRYEWFKVRALPIRNQAGKIVRWFGTAVNIDDLVQAQSTVRELNEQLEKRVRERTAELEAANRELEAFCYSVSHDLRTPLRSIDGFSQAAIEDFGDRLDETGRDYLNRVRSGCRHLDQLIDDLLNLSRVSREQMRREPVSLTDLAESAVRQLRESSPERRVEVRIEPNLTAVGDARLLHAALFNLLANAWKFSAKHPAAVIEMGRAGEPAQPGGAAQAPVFFVRDNGVGFDMKYAGKLFSAFQRLHTTTEFPGSGIGLATVSRVIQRHGGRIWAEAAVGCGATFYFTLESEQGISQQ